MSYVNVEELLEWAEGQEDTADNWIGHLSVVPVEYLKDFIDKSQQSLQPPKTAHVPSSKSYLHSRITKELNAIYVAKNSDYGDAFGETYKKLGIISAVTRITDKVNRLQSLATKSEEERMVKDESIIDTLLDLTNYSLMTLIEMGYEPPND